MEWITLALAVWGAALSTYLGFYKRRRRLLVAADFGVARLGSSRRHGFFVVTAVNVGERAVTIREIEWEVDRDYSFTTHIFKHSKGKDLPVQVDPDEEVRILFDIDAASKHIATYSVRPPPNRSRRDT